ncbi:MAG: ABC transporter permease, partial [Saprospiraceae bacterium]|nr:ABC transporter permease [Saprospiraceae bacterium]
MTRHSFLLHLAWRDGRKNLGKLFLFMSSIVLGIAALVAINSFNANLTRDIDHEAAALLGADLAVTGSRPAGPLTLATLDSLPAQHSTEIELLSMAFIPKTGESQFVRIKALEGSFPYYGKIETVPSGADVAFRQQKGTIIDEGLSLQHGLQIGDSIRLGSVAFPILGSFSNAFASAGISASFAPTVYISAEFMDATELIQPGSLVNYAYYYKIQDPFPIDEWKEERVTRLRTESMRMETVTDRQANVSDAFDQLNYFLNLVAMVALLLGCIGVASSIFIYVKSKIPSIAVFRCLGMKGREAFLVYFYQVIGLGLVGVLLGAALGSGIQMLLPKVLSDFIPLEVNMSISWASIGRGIVLGMLITALFALLPLLAIRKISPLRTLRANIEEDRTQFDPMQLLVFGGIILSLLIFLWQLTGEAQVGLFFVLGLLLAFGLLFLSAQVVMWTVKRYFPRQWNFVFRQGLANLF